MPGRKRLSTHMRRENRSFGLRAIERPPVSCYGYHLDTCRGLADPTPREKVHQRNTRPHLFAPPSAGAIEDDRCLAPRQRREVSVRQLERTRNRAADLKAPRVDVD